ncbi:MAG: tetratricopeptide repeat protein [Desulfobacterales bacterium]|jgi:tetratricopeptide (TPR) repeat protein|nr:tetratricopeptide repeat protein [Desulfobacteraceae bacterium]MBT7086881.1 tetratricopeptide repeat protein [Desulfobacterales bacterium]
MKRFFILLAISILSLFILCCGGKNIKKPTQNHTEIKEFNEGMKEIKSGNLWYNKGCYKQAMRYFSSAHEIFSANDQPRGVAMSYNNMGNAYRAIDDNKSAVLFYDESFGIYSKEGDDMGALQALSNKAAALIDKGEMDEAGKTLDEAESISDRINTFFIPLHCNRGVLLTRKGEFQEAHEVLSMALKKANPGKISEYATANYAMGNLLLKKNDYEKAINYLEKALKADRSIGFHKGMADDLAAIGTSYLKLQKYEKASEYLKRSIKIYALVKKTEKVHEVLEQLEDASSKADIDITVTRHFVKRWMEGDVREGPCD